MEKTYLYRIKSRFALGQKRPASFVAIELRQTERAVYLYGHGIMDPTGYCCRCGKVLKHPGSILIGIGPECLKDWGYRDAVLENITPEQKEELRALMHKQVVDGWFPKRVIKSKMLTNEIVELPQKIKRTKFKNQQKPPSAKVAIVGISIIEIYFPFNMVTVDQVKQLEGRRYIKEQKYWTCSANSSNLLALRQFGFQLTFTENATRSGVWDHIINNTSTSPIPTKENKVSLLANLNPNLRHYQKEGVSLIHHFKGNVLLADEMGLGKTIQILEYLNVTDLKPAIVVCPGSLKEKWKQEAKVWAPNYKAQILEGRKGNDDITGDLLIINYDILANEYKKVISEDTGQEVKVEKPFTGWVDYLKHILPKIIVFDEAHYFANNKAARTKACKKLAKNVPQKIPVTGTPIENSPINIYNAIKMVNPLGVPPYFEFGKRFCDGKNDGFGWNFKGSSNSEQLHELLQNCMIRRLKKDVEKELPDKQFSYVPLEIENRRIYDAAENDFIKYIDLFYGKNAVRKVKAAETLTRINYLEQLTMEGKLNSCISWISDFLESGEKLVVFASSKKVLNTIHSKFKNSLLITGDTANKQRSIIEKNFQTDKKWNLLLGNYIAAGVGFTFTAASNVACIQFPWKPGVLHQGIDRVHRISQNKRVTAWFLHAVNTIEEKKIELLDNKYTIINSILDGKDVSGNLLQDLINNYKSEETC